ncbi:MAG: hypothetical protein QM767_29190 [Anaeromyxobacter sp.]
MCARRRLALRMPERVAALAEEAFRAVRAAKGVPQLPAGQCLAEICQEFIATWAAQSRERGGQRGRLERRDVHCRGGGPVH